MCGCRSVDLAAFRTPPRRRELLRYFSNADHQRRALNAELDEIFRPTN
jgi:S-adenosylmethionine:diacylglycerol 3-amino-3-carboxypropyl transferase